MRGQRRVLGRRSCLGSAVLDPSRRDKRVVEFSRKLSPLWRLTFLKAAGGKRPKTAIKAMCQQCVGYENVREAVSGCSSVRCPLWAYRPYQGKEKRP